MAEALHRAIEDALRDGVGYERRGILVAKALEATRPLDADESLLYRAVYTIFRALPERLLQGTVLSIGTRDVEDGVELVWEGREPLHEAEEPPGKDLRALLGHGPHGDLVDIALRALESFCHMRAGFVETTRQRTVSSSFARPAHVVRRVRALVPTAPGARSPVAPGREAPPGPAPETPPRPGSLPRAPLRNGGLDARRSGAFA